MPREAACAARISPINAASLSARRDGRRFIPSPAASPSASSRPSKGPSTLAVGSKLAISLPSCHRPSLASDLLALHHLHLTLVARGALGSRPGVALVPYSAQRLEIATQPQTYSERFDLAEVYGRRRSRTAGPLPPLMNSTPSVSRPGPSSEERWSSQREIVVAATPALAPKLKPSLVGASTVPRRRPAIFIWRCPISSGLADDGIPRASPGASRKLIATRRNNLSSRK